MTDALDVMAGRRAAGRTFCVLTFDDGYRDVYRHAFPLLKSMGIPALIYLPAQYVARIGAFNHDRLFHLINRARITGFKPIYSAMPAPARAAGAGFLWSIALSAALDDSSASTTAGCSHDVINALETQLAVGRADPGARRRDGLGRGPHPVASGHRFRRPHLGPSVLTLETRSTWSSAGGVEAIIEHRSQAAFATSLLQRLVLRRDRPKRCGARLSFR